MSSGLELKPPSEPPSLEGLDRAERIEAMVDWFRENYEDPAQHTPYESAEGGYQYIWGGPYEAREELSEYFSDADEEDIEAAMEIIEEDGTFDWAPADSRIAPDDLDDDDDAPATQPLADRLEALHEQLNALEEQLQGLTPDGPAGIGHNHPPDDMRLGLEPEDIADAQESIAEIRAELAKPDTINSADPAPIAKAEGRFRQLAGKVMGWIKAAGAMLAAGALEQIGGQLWNDPQGLIVKLHTIADTLQAWAIHLTAPF
jgi:hypothetical protein